MKKQSGFQAPSLHSGRLISFLHIGGYQEVLEINHRHTEGALSLGALEDPYLNSQGPITPGYMAPNVSNPKKKISY